MNFEDLIKEHNLKITPQRLAILSNMHNYGHINIDDLFIQVKNQFTTISLSTLYKNINIMLENSLIKEVKVPFLKPKYEIAKEVHGHALCVKCNKFEDIPIDYSSIIWNIEKKTGYKINESDFIFSGFCKECQ